MEVRTDDRMERILEQIVMFAKSDYGIKCTCSDKGDQLDEIMKQLNNLGEVMSAREQEIKKSETRLKELMNVVLKNCMLDFSAKAVISGKGDELDAVSVGLNTLGEELEWQLSSIKNYAAELEDKNKRLIESEQNVQAMFENAPDAVIVFDIDGKVLRWNTKAEKIFGWTRNEIIGKYLNEVIIPVEYQETCVWVMKSFLTEETRQALNRSIEMEAFNKSGKLFNIALSISPLLINEKHLFVGFIRDITAAKKSEERLKKVTHKLLETNASLSEKEERLNTIFNNTPNAIIATDLQSLVTDWNKGAEVIYGYKKEEILGKNIEDFITTSYGVHFSREKAKEELQLKGLWIGEIKQRTRVKKNLVLFSSNSVLRNEEEQLIGYLAINRDITEEKRLEEELQEKEKIYQLMVNEVEDYAIIMLDKNGYIVSWNKGAEKINGYNEKEMLGVHSSVLYTEEDKLNGTIEEELEAAKREGRAHKTGWKVRKDKSLFWGDVVLTALMDESGKLQGFLKITRDLTEQRKASEEISKKTEELKRSNDELEQFAYIASHDLQEPLRMITSYVQLLSKRYKDKLDADANDFIAFAVDGTNRMQKLIYSILEYSRVNRIKEFEPVDTAEVLQEVKNDLIVATEETGAKIYYEDMPVIFADRTLIGQLFLNLINNSIKFRGDRVPEIYIKGERVNDEYVFSVRDNGIGIQKEYMNKIFVIFKRLHPKDKYPGTGIGLAICKKIVERHGGKIWIESEFGKGSVFYFTIKA